jgi:hypothetical protein
LPRSQRKLAAVREPFKRDSPIRVVFAVGLLQLTAKQKQYDKSVKDFDEAMRLDPMDWVQRDYAFFRATCPEEKYRDGKKAVELAQKAIKLAGKDANWEYPAALAEPVHVGGPFKEPNARAELRSRPK